MQPRNEEASHTAHLLVLFSYEKSYQVLCLRALRVPPREAGVPHGPDHRRAQEAVEDKGRDQQKLGCAQMVDQEDTRSCFQAEHDTPNYRAHA